MIRRIVSAALLAAALAAVVPSATAAPPATPRADCGLGARPEPGIQGRVPAEEVESGRADAGYRCNLVQVGHEGASGGFKVLRFVDRAGHECAYYDTTLLFPLNASNMSRDPTGVAVLDMSDPAKPVRTTTLVTPAMQTPHESLVLSEKRGLLIAVAGNPATLPGVVDIYDLNEDCRSPQLQSSLPVGFLGHESGLAPDGNTFYATSLFDGHVTAVDISNPRVPLPVWTGEYRSHGMTVSDDGNRAYLAALEDGLITVDTSEVQARRPNPQVREVSRLTWPDMSIPQVAIPVTIGGRAHVIEVDEFSTSDHGGPFPAENGPFVGAARIIDMADERRPRVVSDIRLQVHQPENRAQIGGDPGAGSFVQGYAAHYCSVPRRKEPGILACSFIASGLRVFDIRDAERPREIAYFVAPPRPTPIVNERSNFAMSAPDFAPARDEIWYSDGNSGFYALRLTGEAKKAVPAPCLRAPTITFTLHRVKGTRVVRAVAYVNGKRRVTRSGRDLRRLVVRGLKRTGRLAVRVVATHNTGARVVSTRTWDGCRKGKVRVRAVPRR